MSTIFFISVVILFIILFSFINSSEKEKQKLQGAGNKEKYPNFRNALRQAYQDKFTLHADNGKVVTYKIYTLYFDRKVGETFFVLGLSDNRNYLRQFYKGYDNTEIITDKYYLQTKADLSIEEYLEILKKFTFEIVTDSRYLKSTTGLSI